MSTGMWILVVFLGFLVAVAIYDLVQTKHAILKNFPVIGHLRYILESIGPELRQYIVTSNDEERPFSRDERSWVYASAKKQNNYFGFGTDNAIEGSPNYMIIKQCTFPLPEPHKGDDNYDPLHNIPCAKVLGGWRNREKAFRPQSIINLSAMSYGSLSARATEAINRGCAQSNSLHNTGEGGVSAHHDHGAGLIWQLGTGYFGARDADGNFSLDRVVEVCKAHNVKAVEIKLSQGAKPGRGGVLPAEKITEEISRIRGIPMGKNCISPAYHRAFSDVPGLIETVERIADATGLPVGIKSAVGRHDFWVDLADAMEKTGRGPDYIQIDGGEGGTGAAPLVFSDHVSLPWRQAFPRVYSTFAERGLHQEIIFIGSGRLGFPNNAFLAFSIGADMVAVAREAMMAIGCIQAQRCQNGHCPTGVATHNKWLVRGLDPTNKADRLANYMVIFRKELMWLARACGYPHPGFVQGGDVEILKESYGGVSPTELFGYKPGWELPKQADLDAVAALMPKGQT